MNTSQQQFIQLYLSNLHVNVTAMGFNQVWTDWRDLDYMPDYNKFYLIQEGEGWLKIGDTEFSPTAGQWFMMPQGIKQSYSLTDGPRYTKYWCHFTATIGQSNLFDILPMPYFIETANHPMAKQLFEDLLECQFSKDLTAPLLMKAAILKLIAYYIEHATANLTQMKNLPASETLLKAIEYIDLHYKRNISVSELAEQVHLHPNYFSRVFKQHFGSSPIQYINRKKIEEAKWLLMSTSLSLSQISHQIGLSDGSYFSKLFKALTGFSPMAYRNDLQSKS